jgi:hypothetical protein
MSDVPDTSDETARDAGRGDAPSGDDVAGDASTGGGVATAVEDAPAEDEEHAPAAIEAGPVTPDPVRDRLVLPLLLPLAAMLAVFLSVVNISRVLLASGDNASVVVGTIVTVAILGGGAVISASPRLRSSTLVMLLAGPKAMTLFAAGVAVEECIHEADRGPARESRVAITAVLHLLDRHVPGDLAAHAVPRQRRRRSELLGHVAPRHGRELGHRRDLQ